MKRKISKIEFDHAERKMNKILELATEFGRFNYLLLEERKNLAKFTAIVESYENENYTKFSIY